MSLWERLGVGGSSEAETGRAVQPLAGPALSPPGQERRVLITPVFQGSH